MVVSIGAECPVGSIAFGDDRLEGGDVAMWCPWIGCDLIAEGFNA